MRRVYAALAGRRSVGERYARPQCGDPRAVGEVFSCRFRRTADAMNERPPSEPVPEALCPGRNTTGSKEALRMNSVGIDVHRKRSRVAAVAEDRTELL
jgi:hypothetical protein